MKKIILLILTTMLMVGCEFLVLDVEKTINDYNIVVIDSCEYLKRTSANGNTGYGFLPIKVIVVSVKSAGKMNLNI